MFSNKGFGCLDDLNSFYYPAHCHFCEVPVSVEERRGAKVSWTCKPLLGFWHCRPSPLMSAGSVITNTGQMVYQSLFFTILYKTVKNEDHKTNFHSRPQSISMKEKVKPRCSRWIPRKRYRLRERTEEEERVRRSTLPSCVAFEANTAKQEVKYLPLLLFPGVFDTLYLGFMTTAENMNVSGSFGRIPISSIFLQCHPGRPYAWT